MTPLDRDNPYPQQNDLTICVHCGTIMEFDNKLKVKALTSDEIMQLPYDIQLELKAAKKIIDKIHEK